MGAVGCVTCARAPHLACLRLDSLLAASSLDFRSRTPRPIPQAVLDYYPLDSISESFPEDVDARISSMVTCPSQVHIAWCQWVSVKSTTKALKAHAEDVPETHRVVVVRVLSSLSRARVFLRATGLWQLYGFSSHNPDQMLELLAIRPTQPLMLASLIGHLTAARRLLERGASLSLTNCYGRTPLMLAAMAQEELVALLLSLGPPRTASTRGRDASEWARQRGHHHIALHPGGQARAQAMDDLPDARPPPGSIAGRLASAPAATAASPRP